MRTTRLDVESFTARFDEERRSPFAEVWPWTKTLGWSAAVLLVGLLWLNRPGHGSRLLTTAVIAAAVLGYLGMPGFLAWSRRRARLRGYVVVARCAVPGAVQRKIGCTLVTPAPSCLLVADEHSAGLGTFNGTRRFMIPPSRVAVAVLCTPSGTVVGVEWACDGDTQRTVGAGKLARPDDGAP